MRQNPRKPRDSLVTYLKSRRRCGHRKTAEIINFEYIRNVFVNVNFFLYVYVWWHSGVSFDNIIIWQCEVSGKLSFMTIKFKILT